MPDGSEPSVRGRYERRLHSTFRTQANALLRKNGVQQRRAWVQNLVAICMPIFFCLLLWALQKVINNALDTWDNQCGCACLTCKDDRGQLLSGQENCLGLECVEYQLDYTKNPPEKVCGLRYSSSSQAAFCNISTPSTWPALMQAPRMALYQGAEPPRVTALYTGADQTTAQAIAANLFFDPSISDAEMAAANISLSNSDFQSGSLYASALSELGLVYGTTERGRDFLSLYIEPAFISSGWYNATLLNLVDNPAAQSSIDSETYVQGKLNLAAQLGISSLNDLAFNLTQIFTNWSGSSQIDDQLYCGYRQARCNGTSAIQAWDFQNTTSTAYNMRLMYNGTARGDQGPPVILRVNQGINRATNAFLQWALGDTYQTWLLGLQEMPKGGSALRLDFSSLLGPLFFTWLLQLLLPLMLFNLVYEKERRLRTIMKMHGLGDWAYWTIQYCWFFALQLVFTWVLILFGSAINLSFFRRTDYGFQFVFYLLWTNCLVAFAFLLSALFRSSKTAVTVGFLYVLGTGLVGYLLVQQFVSQGYWWVVFLELVPGWALFRGLYEMSQYAFRASYQDDQGMTWSKLGDENNGLVAVMIIMLVEWVVFMLIAWYLEQVMDTGVGVPRHPLFFLGRFRGGTKKGKAAGAGAETVMIPVEAEDVRAERLRVEALPPGGQRTEAIVIRDLHKTFPASGGGGEKHAVRGLSLAIERGECFGLLGPNGAGKSTTLNILTGFLEPTQGTAYVEGHDIRREMPAIYSLMGVCPQDNLLWDRLSAREHLTFYGRLKNLRGEQLKAAVDDALRSVNLFHGGVGDKQVRKYSGGMKRRLSVAISFIGDPLVVYLDEPSTGLDPASRQNLWSVVKQAKRDRGIILTTHSMEEASVLCDRLGIFVDGTLVCVGHPKALTSRYGGYLVFTVTVPPAEEQQADALVRRLSPGARLTYALGGTRKYELPTNEVTLPAVFDAMSAAKQQLTVLDWGIANATLEEVFIQLARSMNLDANLH